MYLGYALLGLVAGAYIGAEGSLWFIGAAFGIATGLLLARLTKLERRVKQLEPGAPRPTEQPSETTSVIAEASPWIEAVPESPSPRPPGAVPALFQTLLKKAAGWISTGNVPVKVGVIISFIGVAFLLKYAMDQQLLVLSLQLRLWAVAAAGLLLLVVGWRLRQQQRVYALSLQGGGIGILFLTIFATLQVWHLIPASLAFVLLVILAALTAVLAVYQNARMLAILGVTGGFLAPVLTSTGEGSHVMLFSYYLLLNVLVLGISWFRAWRGLNLVSWVFTFLIGSLWGYQYYRPALLASTQPFLIAHFLLYQVIAILFALRQPPKRLGLVDGTLVFGTPIIVFALQAALMQDSSNGLAISAVTAAGFYALVAAWLWRSKGEPLQLLTESYIALTVVFATIAIPLAFDARWTAAAWAAEGAALVWIGMRQGRKLARLAGSLLVFLGGLSFIENGWHDDVGLAVLNGNVLGGLLISLSAFFTSRKLETFDIPLLEPLQKLLSVLLFLWAVLWWLGTGWMEIIDRAGTDDQIGPYGRVALFLIYLSLSASIAAWLGHNQQWSKQRRATLALLPLLLLLGLAYTQEHGHFLLGIGWLAWPLAWLVQIYVLKALDANTGHGAPLWHFASLVLLTAGLAIESFWWMHHFTSDAWAGAVSATLIGLMALLVWQLQQRLAWPAAEHPHAYLAGSLVLVSGQLCWLLVLAVHLTGSSHPLTYIPVINPFDLALLVAVLVAVKSLTAISSSTLAGQALYFKLFRLLLVLLFFALTTLALVRGVHHYTDVAWNGDALFDSIVVQTSLSIYWGVLGFAGMIWGARSKRRVIWLAGAGFMALVVLKLFIIDLGNSGTVARIISFIGIGALLLVVGYFAPAPPKAPED